MPRQARVAPGGLVYHVFNRSVAGLPLFRKEKDYEAFERIMIEAQERHPTRLLAWCVMQNHWHFVVWPREEGEITAHFRWLAHIHVCIARNRPYGNESWQGLQAERLGLWHTMRSAGRPKATASTN
jgi:REP element-mobilizing transposase RayT